MKIFDTHQHLIYPEQVIVPWSSDYPVLDRAFQLEDYEAATEGFEIDGTLFMEVDVAESDMKKEAAFFSNLSRKTDTNLCGIIAAVRPENPGFREHIEAISSDSLKAVRRVLHVVPDAISTSTLFRDNVKSLSHYDLPFDMCYQSNQLDLAYELVSYCPDVQFILDHCGNPKIGEGESDTWKQRIERLATLPNVTCKLSGIVVNCGERFPSLDLLRPYLDVCLRSFGADRLVFGSDWPVCLLAVEARTWFEIFMEWCEESLSDPEQDLVCHANAKRVYNI